MMQNAIGSPTQNGFCQEHISVQDELESPMFKLEENDLMEEETKPQGNETLGLAL